MRTQHAFTSTLNGSFPMLDEEFDKLDLAPPAADNTPVFTPFLCDDLAWEDQLDNGDEVSL